MVLLNGTAFEDHWTQNRAKLYLTQASSNLRINKRGCTHLSAVPRLDGQDLVADALPDVTLAAAPDRRHCQQRQLPQLWPRGCQPSQDVSAPLLFIKGPSSGSESGSGSGPASGPVSGSPLQTGLKSVPEQAGV